jgi:pyrimidine-nucleoside phosphorylase
MIGNWLEVVESVECLKGRDVPDLMEVTYVLGGAMLWLGKKSGSIREGIEQCKEVIANGKAYEKFSQLVKRQGGDCSYLDNPASYPPSAFAAEVRSESDGFVASYSTMELGLLAIELGAGRTRVDDVIDPKAGIVITKKIGDPVAKGELLATLYTDKSSVAEPVARRWRSLIHIGPSKVVSPRTIVSFVDKSGVVPWDVRSESAQ